MQADADRAPRRAPAGKRRVPPQRAAIDRVAAAPFADHAGQREGVAEERERGVRVATISSPFLGRASVSRSHKFEMCAGVKKPTNSLACGALPGVSVRRTAARAARLTSVRARDDRRTILFEVFGKVQGVSSVNTRRRRPHELDLAGWCLNDRSQIRAGRGVRRGRGDRSILHLDLGTIGSPKSKLKRAEIVDEEDDRRAPRSPSRSEMTHLEHAVRACASPRAVLADRA